MFIIETGLQFAGETSPLIQVAHVTAYQRSVREAFDRGLEEFPLCAEYEPEPVNGRNFNAFIKIVGVYCPEKHGLTFSGENRFQYIGIVNPKSKSAPGSSVRVIFPHEGDDTFEVWFSNDPERCIQFA